MGVCCSAQPIRLPWCCPAGVALGLPSEGAALGCGYVSVGCVAYPGDDALVKPEHLEIRKNDDDNHTSIGQYVIVNPS